MIEPKANTSSDKYYDDLVPLAEGALISRTKSGNVKKLSARCGTVLPNSSFLVDEVSGILRTSMNRRSNSNLEDADPSNQVHVTASLLRRASFLSSGLPDLGENHETYGEMDGELIPVRHYDM